MNLPQIKKSILGFLLDDSGKCSKTGLLKLGVLSLALSAGAEKVKAASDYGEVIQDMTRIGINADGKITAPAEGRSGGYDSTPKITLKFSFNQLQDVGIYPKSEEGFLPMQAIGECTTFQCTEMSDHLSDSSCCAVSDHFSATGTVDLPTVNLHKNSLILESGDSSILTAQHMHEVDGATPGRRGCILNEHVNHYNTTGNPCSYDDVEHLNSSTTTGWVYSEYCGED